MKANGACPVRLPVPLALFCAQGSLFNDLDIDISSDRCVYNTLMLELSVKV